MDGNSGADPIRTTVEVEWRGRRKTLTYDGLTIYEAAKKAALETVYPYTFHTPERIKTTAIRGDTPWPVEIEVSMVAKVVGPLRTD